MTTIAWNAGILAADSFCTDDSSAMLVTKALQRADGDVAGAAGNIDECAGFLRYFAGGMKGEAPAMSNIAAIFTIAGLPYVMSGGLPGTPLKSYAAVGSGAQGAMVAMKMGHTPAEAVAAVIGVDPGTGGPIDVFHVARKPVGKPVRRNKDGGLHKGDVARAVRAVVRSRARK